MRLYLGSSQIQDLTFIKNRVDVSTYFTTQFPKWKVTYYNIKQNQIKVYHSYLKVMYTVEDG